MLREHFRYMEESQEDGGDGGSTVDTATDQTTDTSTTTIIDDVDNLDSQDKGTWPDDWRAEFSGGDEKLVKRFERYSSPKDVASALIAAQSKISSGEMTSKLPENPSDDELAAYRKDHGIPEDVSGYTTELGDGLVIGDDDKPLVDAFLKAAHETNQTQGQVNAGIQSYFAMRQVQQEAQNDQDHSDRESGEDALRAEFGSEFRRNIKMAHNYLDGVMDPEVKESFLNGRLSDGSVIGNNPLILKALVSTSLKLNPSGTITPAGGGDLADTIQDEIKGIEDLMKNDRPKYNKDEKLQARYRELLTAQEKL